MIDLLSHLLPLANGTTGFMFEPGGHHADPAGIGEFVITFIGSLIVLGVIVATVAYFLRPREQEEDHIKRRILDDSLKREGSRS